MMKEAEVDDLAMPWVNARVAHLLLVCRMTTVEVNVHPECGDHRALLLLCRTSKGRKGLHGRMH